MDERAPIWLVTGAATGFGRAVAEQALAAGHRVAATARDPSRLADLVAAHPTQAVALPLDVTEHLAASRSIAAAAEALGGNVDIVVNAAGYGLIGAVEEVDEDELRLLMETHLFGAMAVTRAALPGMRAHKRGHIFNFSSVAGIAPTPGTAHYSAAKAAIEAFSEGLVKEVAQFEIRVTVVEPGPFQTRFFTGTSGRVAARSLPDYAETVGPLRRLITDPPSWCPGDPERAARILVDLALSPAAPLRLPLGAIAWNVAKSTLLDRLDEVERFRALSESADFPEAAGRNWP